MANCFSHTYALSEGGNRLTPSILAARYSCEILDCCCGQLKSAVVADVEHMSRHPAPLDDQNTRLRAQSQSIDGETLQNTL